MLKDHKFLVVDNDKATGDLILKYLSDNGYTVKLSESYTEAEVLSKEYNVFIIDARISESNGLSLSEYIKSNYPESEVILIIDQADAEKAKFIENRFKVRFVIWCKS